MFLSVCLPIGPHETKERVEATLRSIARQSCAEVEVVIKACNLELAVFAQEHAQENGLSCVLVMDEDSGIYDAFNLCARNAKGDYLLFLGCGDQLCDYFTVEDISAECNRFDRPEVVYGSVLLADESGVIFSSFDNSCFFRRGFVLPWWNPCHSQGLFYRRDWLLERSFRTDLGPLADLVHTHQYNIALIALWLNRPVSIFRIGGISNNQSFSVFRKRLVGYMGNCEQFRPALLWKLLTLLVLLVGRLR